jgi:WD40 repeat protein
VVVSPDGKRLAWGSGADLCVWEPGGKEPLRLRGHQHGITSVAFSPDGKTLAAGDSEATVALWDIRAGKQIHPGDAHGAPVTSVAYAPDGKALTSASLDGTVRFWEPGTGRQLRLFRQLNTPARSIQFSPDGKALASAGGDEAVRLWDVTTGKEVRRLRGHRGEAGRLAFSPGGTLLASGGADRVVRLWEVATGKELHALPCGERKTEAPCPAFSPDGKVLAVASGLPAVRLFDVSTGKCLRRLAAGKKYRVDAVQFSPDGTVLAGAGEDGAVYVWDVATGEERAQFTRPHDWDDYFGGSVVAFSPDGRALAIGGLSSPVTVWEVATGQKLRTFDTWLGGRSDRILSLAFSPDGRELASGGNGHFAVLVWDMTGLRAGGRAGRTPLAREQMAALWKDLASADARQADRAVWRLATTPGGAVGFFGEHLRPVAPVAEDRLAGLVETLKSGRFAVRDKAMRELRGIGELAEPALRAALAGRPPLELAQRVNRLLGELKPDSPRRLAVLRAIKMLEQHGTPAARALLHVLAKGAERAWLTQEARASLQRLARRAAAR